MIRVIFFRAFLAGGEPVPVPRPASAPGSKETSVTATDLLVPPGADAIPVVAGQPCPPGIPPVRLSDTEAARVDALARAFTGGFLSRARYAFHLRWSRWRRRHQARARWSHYSARLAPSTG